MKQIKHILTPYTLKKDFLKDRENTVLQGIHEIESYVLHLEQLVQQFKDNVGYYVYVDYYNMQRKDGRIDYCGELYRSEKKFFQSNYVLAFEYVKEIINAVRENVYHTKKKLSDEQIIKRYGNDTYAYLDQEDKIGTMIYNHFKISFWNQDISHSSKKWYETIMIQIVPIIEIFNIDNLKLYRRKGAI